MSEQTLNLGTVANDGTGDALRVAMTKIKDMLHELYVAVGLNTTKVTNANHSGDATGSDALILKTVNATPGTYTNATVIVNEKGLVTAATTGSTPAVTLQPSSGTKNLAPGNNTYTPPSPILTYPYSVMITDATNMIIPDLQAVIALSGGEYVLNIWLGGDEALNGVKIKIIY